MTLRALALSCALVATASADPSPRLRLTREPPPRNLRMRPRATTRAAAAPQPARSAPSAARSDLSATTRFAPSDAEIGRVRDLERPVSAQLTLGYAVDGAPLSGLPTIDDWNPGKSSGFQPLRAYAVGAGYLSSRGLLLPSLSTYVATGFQIARPSERMNDVNRDIALAPPIALWFERSAILPRAGWVELKDFLGDRRLAPLRVRGGQFYAYGPWPMHVNGALAGWDGSLGKLTVYGGSRVPDYTLGQRLERDRAWMLGLSGRVDLRAHRRKLPLAASVELLSVTATGSATQRGSRHALFQLDWRPRADVALIAHSRTRDGRVANQHVQLRSRYKQVTNLVFDVTKRGAGDWRWDPSIPGDDPLQARRYLDLGPVVPQVVASGRAGTLIKENVDVLVRGAIASERVDNRGRSSTFTASYSELGVGFEVRLRRTVALGASALTRQTSRFVRAGSPILDQRGVEQPLPRPYSPTTGDLGFTEAGATLRLSLGGRQLTAVLEGYGRRTRYAPVYCSTAPPQDSLATCTPGPEDDTIDEAVRGGGRVAFEAMLSKQLRLFASYEQSTRLTLAPEIAAIRSLRLIMEGTY